MEFFVLSATSHKKTATKEETLAKHLSELTPACICHRPPQRGSNELINGTAMVLGMRLRMHRPNSTDLQPLRQGQLQPLLDVSFRP